MRSTATTASSLETCASHGGPITSPMAYTPATLVAYVALSFFSE